MVSVEAADLVDEALPAPHPGQVLGLGELNNDLELFWGGLHKVLGQREPEVDTPPPSCQSRNFAN